MLRSTVGAVVAVFLTSLPAAGKDGWICIADAAGGVRFDEGAKSWQSAVFNPNMKFIVRRPDSQDHGRFTVRLPGWIVQPFGEARIDYECHDTDENGYILCQIGVGTMRINTNGLRFMATYEYGYVDGRDEGGNTPYIAIGTCAPF